jgi:hypothetical protein
MSSSEEDSGSDSSSLRYTHPGIRDEGGHGFPLLEDDEVSEGEGPSGWSVDWNRVQALWKSGQSMGIFADGDRSEVDADAENNVDRALTRVPSNAYTTGDLIGKGAASGPLCLDWHALCRSRTTLERRLREPGLIPRVMRIEGHDDR